MRSVPPSKRAIRALILMFTLGLLLTVGLLLWTAFNHTPGGPETFRTAIGPLTFFESTRSTLPEGGSTVELNFGFGVAVLLILLPGLAAALAWFKRPAAAKQEAQTRG